MEFLKKKLDEYLESKISLAKRLSAGKNDIFYVDRVCNDIYHMGLGAFSLACMLGLSQTDALKYLGDLNERLEEVKNEVSLL